MSIAEPQENTFVFPRDLEPGMRVIVSTDPTFANPGSGIIAGVEGESAYIFFFGGNSKLGPRAGMLMDCWHADDPRVKRQPSLINDQELRGIFRLATSEEQVKLFTEQFKAMEAVTEALMERLVKLEARLKKLEK